MWTSSRAGEGSRGGRAARRGGFTLVEALVALAVAGLLLPALARAMGAAWSASRAPMEVVTAVALAGDVAAGGAVPPEARARGYAAERDTYPAQLLELPSAVAPAPGGTGEGADLKPEATPAGIRLAAPKGFGAPSPAGAARGLGLRRVSVSVRTPSGRRVVLDHIERDDAGR